MPEVDFLGARWEYLACIANPLVSVDRLGPWRYGCHLFGVEGMERWGAGDAQARHSSCTSIFGDQGALDNMVETIMLKRYGRYG